MSAVVGPTIMTSTGGYFDFSSPDPIDVSIQDIAHALSHICRFTGHTRVFYSVAQHSEMVSRLVPQEDALCGLLHDAAEAYLGDVSTPLKRLLPDYQAIERRVEQVIRGSFNLPNELPASVKQADLVMLCTERRDLLPPDASAWPILDGVTPLALQIEPWPPALARAKFLARFASLTPVTYMEPAT